VYLNILTDVITPKPLDSTSSSTTSGIITVDTDQLKVYSKDEEGQGDDTMEFKMNEDEGQEEESKEAGD